MHRLLVSLVLCGLYITGLCAPADEQEAGAPERRRIPVTIEISAQEVYYSRERGLAYARGAVEVTIQRRDVPEQWAKLRAGEVTSDLERGIVDAQYGVRLETEQAVLSGRKVRVDAGQEQFWLRGATAVADLAPLDDRGQPHAYFTGQEIRGKTDVVTIIRGRITTCDREKPHWAVEAREITYRSKTGRMRVRGGSLRLYGLKIPLIASFNTSIGEKEEGPSGLFSSVSYNSRDRLYAPGSLAFTGPKRSTQLTTAFKLSSRRGWVGTLLAEHDSPTREWYAVYERRGDRYDNVDDYVEVDRAPEIGIVQHLIPDDSPRAETDLFDLTLSSGYFRERPLHFPGESAGRLHLSLDRRYHQDEFEELVGGWYGWNARLEHYDDGKTFHALQLLAGRGVRLSDRLSASLTGLYHFYGGETPLRCDDVDIRAELRPTLDWDMTDKWRVRATARVDARHRDTRDYIIQLDRQVHCLTWYVRYREVGNTYSVGINLSGLTGGTRPFESVREPEWLKPLQPDPNAGPEGALGDDAGAQPAGQGDVGATGGGSSGASGGEASGAAPQSGGEDEQPATAGDEAGQGPSGATAQPGDPAAQPDGPPQAPGQDVQ